MRQNFLTRNSFQTSNFFVGKNRCQRTINYLTGNRIYRATMKKLQEKLCGKISNLTLMLCSLLSKDFTTNCTCFRKR